MTNFRFKESTEIVGTCYITFNVCDNGTHKKTKGCSPKYLDENAYAWYVEAFEKNASSFNYYGPTYFNRAALLNVQKSMYKIQERYRQVETMQSLIDFTKVNMPYTSLCKELEMMQNKEGFDFQLLLKEILILGSNIVKYTEMIVSENRVLLIEGL